MRLTTSLLAAATAAFLMTPAIAEIMVKDAYARSASPAAKTGAAFMMLMNTGDAADTLLSASSDAARRVELHTHIDAGDGVMQMRQVEGGFEVPAGGMTMLKRGGHHVMLMGLTKPFMQGNDITVTFTFEKAGEMIVTIPIDLERQDTMDHSHKSDG